MNACRRTCSSPSTVAPVPDGLVRAGSRDGYRGDRHRRLDRPAGDFRTIDYVILSGRALVYPMYCGTYERNAGQTGWPERTRAFQDSIIRTVKSATGHRIRPVPERFRHDEIAFFGVSWGARWGRGS